MKYMRICHLCLNGPYNEGWNYQENILPKYHVKQGHEVYQIVTPYMWEGTEQIICNEKEYTSPDGVNIIRCTAKQGLIGGNRLNRYPEIHSLLEKISPEILFIHDVQFMDAPIVAEYLKRHPKCTAYADNHSDFSNSARNWISKNLLHKILWKHMAQVLNPYVKKFYGVLPARVDFLIDMYRIPKEKCELLVMGADDEYVEKSKDVTSIKHIRDRYNIDTNDFLIVTGGKIDLAKKQTLLLMDAVRKREDNVKLIVFGSVAPELQDKFNALCDNVKVKYAGWISANEACAYFAASNVVFFPGRHSVFWEQVAALGKPMVVKYWAGTTHIDCDGNVLFLYKDTQDEIQLALDYVADASHYHSMLIAARRGVDKFLYSNIAEQSIK